MARFSLTRLDILTVIDTMGWSLSRIVPGQRVLLWRSNCRRRQEWKRRKRNGSLGGCRRDRWQSSTDRLRSMGESLLPLSAKRLN